jgi:hypothetical protein
MMHGQPSVPHDKQMWPTIDRGLAALIMGALLLIAVGVIAVPLTARRTPPLAPVTTPEGTVQRFYQAAYTGDYSAAYAFLSADTQRRLSLIELQQQLSVDLLRSQARISTTRVTGSHATVRVILTHFDTDSIFGSNEWQEEREVLLQHEGAAWKIVSGPFFVPALEKLG